jgi:hypothetical protein
VQSKLDQWRTLPGRERLLLAELALLLPTIGLGLKLLGVRRTFRLLERSLFVARRSTASDDIDDASLLTAARLGRLVDIASRHGPYAATCLRQSLALWWLLRRRGLSGELRIGVGKEESELRVHSWVECDGQVVNDRAWVGDKYAVFAGLNQGLQNPRVDAPMSSIASRGSVK